MPKVVSPRGLPPFHTHNVEASAAEVDGADKVIHVRFALYDVTLHHVVTL